MASRRAATLRVVWLVVLVACAAERDAPAQHATQVRTAHVYVLNGLFNISPGLEQLADKIRRAGIPATVHNHGRWRTLAAEAIAQYRRGQLRSIVIIGHSMGGAAAARGAIETIRDAGASHWSIIAAHEPELLRDVLAAVRPKAPAPRRAAN